ncbi:hypothetical protein SAMN04487934_102109 [Eubacterium ruminantium]|nr:hypothetical protein SAMN04487934_102109 [Eubacterium ruminantium]
MDQKRKRIIAMPLGMILISFVAVILSIGLKASAGVNVYETTINDGTASFNTAPVDGNNVDYYQKNQHIIKASQLTDMKGKVLSSMKYYIKNPSRNLWTGNFKVYLKEITEEGFSGNTFFDINDAILVYEGPLDATGSTMTINFDTFFLYYGDNLLVAFYQTESDCVYSGCDFYGQTTEENVALEGTSYYSLDAITSGWFSKFAPKTTFTYQDDHDHDMEFSVDGPTIKAVCKGDCYLKDFVSEFTLHAPELDTIGDNKSPEAWVTGRIPGYERPNIVYMRGGTVLNEPPTAAGLYTISISAGGVTASLEYVIGETYTLFENTAETSYTAPIYSNYLDNYSKSQFIIPASYLQDIKQNGLYSMSFYIVNPTVTWTSKFCVYLEEVTASEFTGKRFLNTNNAQLVYDGPLDSTKNVVKIRFNKGFDYKGGNLLVSIYSYEPGSYGPMQFYCKTTDKDLYITNDDDDSLENITEGRDVTAKVLPKVTFTCLPKGPVITASPVDCKVIRGSKARFTVGATGDNIQYKWYISNDGENWRESNAAGNDTASIYFKGTEKLNGSYFKCLVSNDKSASFTKPAKLTTLPVISAQPKNAAGTVDSEVTFTLKSRSSVAKFEWQISTDGGESWKKSSADGFDTATLTVPVKLGSYNGYLFRCKVTNGTWVEYTKTAELQVKPQVLVQQPDVTEYYGNLAKLYVKASGTDPKYQWQVKSPVSGKWGNSSQPGNDTNILRFTATPTTSGREFRCKITDNGFTTYSDTVSFTAVSNILSQPKSVTVKKGETAKFTINATGTEGEMSYYWQYSKDNGKTWTGVLVNGAYVKTNVLTLGKVSAKNNGWLVRCRVMNRKVITFSDEVSLNVE